ncbi:MAG: hypothetical protein HGA35_02110, partial [Erysipelotrichaceae bacterium]|nr:hypothetical protein [Erysipelotrichaceae bacterium]
MINEAHKLITTKKSILQSLLFFVIFMIIYTVIDRNNMSYTDMSQSYGSYLVYTNISLNIVMALLSSLMLML